jgi:hypothetical protein
MSISYIPLVTAGVYSTGQTLSQQGYSPLLTSGLLGPLPPSGPLPNFSERVRPLATDKALQTAFQPLQLTDLQGLSTVHDVNGSVVVPSSFGFIDLGSGQRLQWDPDTQAGKITPSNANVLLADLDSNVHGGVMSYTGSDIRIMIEVPNTQQGDARARYAKQLLECTTFTVSIHREKSPVRAAGYINPKAFARGKRTIAGTFIMTQFTVEVLLRFLQTTLMSDRSKDTHFMKVDQLPPFNITILYSSENGFASFRRLLGVEFVTDGIVYSIQDMISEQTISYMAADLTPLIPLTLSSLYQPGTSTDRTTQREKSVRDLFPGVFDA